MKKIYIILLIATVFGLNNHSNAQNFIWAKQLGGADSEIGTSLSVDINGNVYTTGYFSDTADFDPGPATYNLISVGLTDIFISKVDASGNFIWAKQFGGISNDESNSIDVDNNGDVYTTGYFTGTVDFDPGIGTYNLISAGDKSIFVSKLDPAGNFVWAMQLEGISKEIGNSIKADDLGNIYISGYFIGTVDFDPTNGFFNMTSMGGSQDIFISKFDTAGNFGWAKQIGGTYGDEGFSIYPDNNGNVYITGDFWDTVDFDPGAGVYNLTTIGGQDIFICKLDTMGNFIWAKQMSGGGVWDNGYSINIDNNGDVYITGQFSDTVDFDPGPGIYNLISFSAGIDDMYICKLNAAGIFEWAMAFGNYLPDGGLSITSDAIGNVYTTGAFNGTIDFDPGPGIYNLTANSQEIFILKTDASGNFIWARQMVGSFYELATSIFVDNNGYIYITGVFRGTVDFDPGLGIYNLTTGNFDYDVCVVKLGNVTGIMENSDLISSINIYPNPATDYITIQYNLTNPKETTVSVYNVYGQPLTPKGEIKHTGRQEIKIDMRNFPAGVYFVKVIADGKEDVRKVVKY